MSDGWRPVTTARAIALAAVVGTAALVAADLAAGVGVLFGLALAAALRGFDSSLRRILLASALLPAAVAGAIAAVAATASARAGAAETALVPVLTILGAIVAVTAAALASDWPRTDVFLRAGTAALAGAGAAAPVAGLAGVVATAGGLGAGVLAVLSFGGPGLVGLLGWILLAGVGVGAAIAGVPPAAYATPRRRDAAIARRNAWVRATGTATVAALLVAMVAAAIGWFVPPLGALFDVLAASVVVRGLLALAAAGGVAVFAVAGAVWLAWSQRSSHGSAIVPVLAGAGCGVAGAAALAGIGAARYGISADLVSGLFAATAAVLVGGWLVLWWVAGTAGATGPPDPASTLAAALAAGGVAVAAAGDATGTGLEAVRTGLPPLLAIAAALFAYDVGRYGRVLGVEIGREGATRRPQLVRIGWSGAVAAVGVPVAAGGLWLATVLAPTLSVPATVGVLVAVGAVGGGAWLLLR